MLWDKALETGIKSVDEQHKELFRRIDMLTDTKNADRVPQMLEFLEEYVHIHFADEERLQQSSRYPKAAIHKTYHQGFINTLQQLKHRLRTEGDTLLVKLEVNKTVFNWLQNHILVHDKEFAKYYRENGF